MNTPSTDPELDSDLAGLPYWQPPQDFATRLAAAAARQQAALQAPAPTRNAWIRQASRRFALHAMASAALATALALAPWANWAAHPAFAWSIAGSSAAAGLLMTRRVLRLR